MKNKYLEKAASIKKKASMASKAYKELKTVSNMSGNPFLSRAAKNVEKKYGAKHMAEQILKGKHTPKAKAS